MLMQPGCIQFVRVALDAPAVKKRTQFLMTLEAHIAPGKLADVPGNVAADIVRSWPPVRTDRFAIQVFPDAETKIAVAGLKIALYDDTGRTTDLLDKAGLDFVPLRTRDDLEKCNLVVVGRDSFTDEFRRLAAEIGLERAIASGKCDMLVFEQKRSGCAFDRELTNASVREAFIVDRTHPVLAGLCDEDLRDWRGETDEQPSAPPVMGYMRPGTPYFPKWTNEGVVSSFPMKKPEYGNFRVILDCWFDLGWTPLWEAMIGRGSVMFCQLDVTNERFGKDPVVTRIVRNLFTYYAQRAENRRESAGSVPVYYVPGDKRAEKLLSDRAVHCKPFGDEADPAGVLVIVGKAGCDQKVRDFVAAGGRVLYLTDGASGEPLDEAILPNAVGARPVNELVYELTGDEPLLRGLSQSDLHFKGSPRMLRIVGAEALVRGGVVAKVDYGKGFYLFAPWIDVSKLEDLRLMSAPKVERLYSTLLTNLGVRQGGIAIAPKPPHVARSVVLNKWDFETSNRDGTAPFDRGRLVTQPDARSGSTRCIESQPVRKTWCAVGIPDVRLRSGPRLTGDVYVSFRYKLSKPTWLLVILRAGGDSYVMSERIEARRPDKWVPVCLRLDRFEGYPPTGLNGAEASMLEFYAGDPQQRQEGLQLYIDDVTFYDGPPASDVAEAYIPLLKRSPYRYPYDPDTYVRW